MENYQATSATVDTANWIGSCAAANSYLCSGPRIWIPYYFDYLYGEAKRVVMHFNYVTTPSHFNFKDLLAGQNYYFFVTKLDLIYPELYPIAARKELKFLYTSNDLSRLNLQNWVNKIYISN
ncbi:MAG: hypothetical protein QXI12_07390, partial [Candidatus Methanomethyliaceae archaeon]